MNCLSSIVKYIIYIFNVIFLICGILLIVLGSIMLSNMGEFKSFTEAVNVGTIPILIICLGCIVFVVSFFGCCGAIKENACLMSTYAISMFIIFVLQLTLVIWMFVQRNEFLKTMNTVVDRAWQDYNNNDKTPMNSLQVAFKCCGVTNYKDYTTPGLTVPSSCCGTLEGTCSESIYKYKPGCKGEFYEFWSYNINIIRYAGIAVAIIELVVFIFASCLANSMRRSSHNL